MRCSPDVALRMEPGFVGRSVRYLACGLALLGWLVVLAAGGSTAAQASHSVGGFVGGSTIGAPATPEGRFIQPRDVAVYVGVDGDPATDKILTSESLGGRGRIQRLDRHGNFERMWGRDVIGGNAATGYEVCTANCQYGFGGSPTQGTLGGEFDDQQGLAVSQVTGHVFVLDRDNLRVQEFDLDGGFVRAFGWNVVQEGTTNDTPTDQFETCFVASECQAGVAGAGDGQFAATTANGGGIAIDPVNGNVFVADPGNGRAQEFVVPASPAGPVAFEDKFGAIGAGLGQFDGATTAGSQAGEPLRIAVDANHVVYASDLNGSGRIQRYDALGNAFLAAPIGTGGTPGNPLLAGGLAATSGLEVDPATNNLYVLRDPSTGSTVIQELSTPGGTATEVLPRHDPGMGTATVNNLGYKPSTDELIVAANNFNSTTHGLLVLTDDPGPLTDVLVSAPASVGADTASLRGSIDPNDGVVSYQFEISSNGVDFSPVGNVGYLSGSGSQVAAAEVSGLAPNTVYRVRLMARKQTGASTSVTVRSTEAIFTTDAVAPEVETLGATAVRSTSATLQGTVDPNGAPTTYYFEYGTTTGYGARVPATDANAGSGAAPESVANPVVDLLPDTVYHFRLVAESQFGLVRGASKTFRTRPSASPVGRAFELVSPPYKVAGSGVGFAYTVGDLAGTQPGFAARDSDRYVIAGHTGATLVDGSFSYANDWAFAERTETGWVSRSPFTRTNYGPAYNRFANVRAFSDDFETLAWSSNGARISLFPETEGWPINMGAPLLGDWTGRYEPLAPTDPAQGDGDPLTGNRQIVSATGSHALVVSLARGMADDPGVDGVIGTGDDVLSDPTRDQAAGTLTTYVDDVSGGLSDSFPGGGDREPVAVCTDGTLLPSVNVAGDLTTRPCPAPTEYAPGLFRDAALIDARGTSLGLATQGFGTPAGAISTDGSSVFFNTAMPASGGAVMASCTGTADTTACPSQVYVRHESDDGTVATRWISRPTVAGQDASLLGPALFEGATPDGDKVFFRTTSPLTADDPNGGCGAPCTTGAVSANSWDLYEYDFSDDPGDDPGVGTLTRISAGPTGAADPNVSAGSGAPGGEAASLRFVSDDGRRSYFVTAAPLPGAIERDTGNVTDPAGESANGSVAAAASNLYLYDTDRPPSERWEFVARLPRDTDLARCATTGSGGEGPLASNNSVDGILVAVGGNCVSGTPSGDLVSFLTNGRLVAGDPDVTSGDVYVFDAAAGELVRASAPQGGIGGSYECAAGVRCFGDLGLGRSAKRGIAIDPVDGSTTVYFQSKGRLLPGDVDDHDDEYDVYAWREGDLSLLTPGTSTPAYYTGNSADGRNVFVMTRDRLTWQDVDAVHDIYVTRAGSAGIPQPPPPVVCSVLAGACQGGGASPEPAPIESNAPGGSNASPTPEVRVDVKLASPGRNAREQAVRTGVVRLPLRVNAPGDVQLVARARMTTARGRVVRKVVARREVSLRKAGRSALRLRLSRAARRYLGDGRALTLTVRARATGGDAATVSFELRRGSR